MPLVNGSDNSAGKDPKTGKFLKGHKFAKGNPHGKKVNDFRTAFMEAISVQDVKDILEVLKKQALAGDIKSLIYVLDRALGKATQTINIDGAVPKTYIAINIEDV